MAGLDDAIHDDKNVELVSPNGEPTVVPIGQFEYYTTQRGFRPQTVDEHFRIKQAQDDKAVYGNRPVEALLQGAANTLSFGAYNELLGRVAPETARNVPAYNSPAYTAGEMGAFLVPTAPFEAIGEAGARAAEAVGRSLPAAEGVAGRLIGAGVRGVAQGATEGALYGMGKATTHALLSDDPANAEAMLEEIGSPALYGGAIGGVLSTGAQALAEASSQARALADHLHGNATAPAEQEATRAAVHERLKSEPIVDVKSMESDLEGLRADIEKEKARIDSENKENVSNAIEAGGSHQKAIDEALESIEKKITAPIERNPDGTTKGGGLDRRLHETMARAERIIRDEPERAEAIGLQQQLDETKAKEDAWRDGIEYEAKETGKKGGKRVEMKTRGKALADALVQDSKIEQLLDLRRSAFKLHELNTGEIGKDTMNASFRSLENSFGDILGEIQTIKNARSAMGGTYEVPLADTANLDAMLAKEKEYATRLEQAKAGELHRAHYAEGVRNAEQNGYTTTEEELAKEVGGKAPLPGGIEEMKLKREIYTRKSSPEVKAENVKEGPLAAALGIAGTMLGNKVAGMAGAAIGGPAGALTGMLLRRTMRTGMPRLAGLAESSLRAFSSGLDAFAKRGVNPLMRAAPMAAGEIVKRVSYGPTNAKPAKDERSALMQRISELAAANSNPEKTADMIHQRLAGVGAFDLKLADQMAVLAQNKLSFLWSKMPKNPGMGTVFNIGANWKLSDAEVASASRYIAASEYPIQRLTQELKSGRLTMETADTIQTLFPGLYNRMLDSFIQNAEALQKNLKYSMKLDLHLLLKVPVDATMAPDMTVSLQANHKFAQVQKQQARVDLGAIQKPEPTPGQKFADG